MSTGTPQLNFTPPPGYRIVDYLGGGAMGQVYKAVHTTLDREVAIKTTLPAANPRLNLSPQRLLNEARTIAKLDHPGIVGIYDCFVIEDRIYIVMEYLDGLTLGDILYASKPGELDPLFTSMLERAGQLRPEWVKRIGMEVAGALEFAHRRGICHRDIKPSNLFITRQGAIKIIDFSIAINVTDSRLTASGSVIGSPPYMSPEQIKGEPIDGRSDIYSLGCVLFHCITGKVPFYDTSEVLVCMKHLEADPPDPTSLTPLCDAQLRAVILRCLAKAPDDRFATAADLALALEQTSTAGITILQDDRRPRPASRDGAARKDDSSGHATVFMDSKSAPAPPGGGSGSPAARRGARRSKWMIALLALIGIAACVGAAWIFIQQMDQPRPAMQTAAATPTMPEITPGATPEDVPPIGAIHDPVTPIATAIPVEPLIVETTAAPPPLHFPPDNPILQERWAALIAWARESGAREWPIRAAALHLDADSGPPGLKMLNVSDAPAEFSFLVGRGALVSYSINDDGDWSLQRTERPLAGWGDGAAFGGPPLRLNPGEEGTFPFEEPIHDGFFIQAQVDDVHIAAIPSVIDTPTSLPLAAIDAAATATLTSDAPATASALLTPVSSQPVELQLLAGAISATTRTVEDAPLISQGIETPLVATLIFSEIAGGLPAWRERMERRLALPAGYPPIDSRLRAAGDTHVAEDLELFLRHMIQCAVEGRLIDVGLYSFRSLSVDRFTGEIDLQFEFLAPEGEVEISWFIVDGEQRLRAREGSQSRALWRPLRGLHGIGRTVPVNRAAKAFTLSLDAVFSDREMQDRALFYERTDRVIIRTMLVICAQTRPGAGAAEGTEQPLSYELVSGIRWGAQP